MKLSVVVVTKAEPYAIPFIDDLMAVASSIRNSEFLIGLDGDARLPRDLAAFAVRTNARGFIENVLDQMVNQTRGEYVLRLDDDERCSEAMVEWLQSGAYAERDHWRFLMAQLWTPTEMILNSPLYPNGH